MAFKKETKRQLIKREFNNTSLGKTVNSTTDFSKEFLRQEGIKAKLGYTGRKTLEGIKNSKTNQKFQARIKAIRAFISANLVLAKTIGIISLIGIIVVNMIFVLVGVAQAIGPTPHYYCNPKQAEQLSNSKAFLQYCSTSESNGIPQLTEKFYFPTQGVYTSKFGWRPNPTNPGAGVEFHEGIDIAGGAVPVRAVLPGTVISVESDPNAQWGIHVIIDHGVVGGKKVKTMYVHQDTITVKVGDKVLRGQDLGIQGNTGRSTGRHLHFQVWIDDEIVDPEPLLAEADPYEE